MPLSWLDVNSNPLNDLRLDTPDPTAYKQFLLKNPGTGTVQDVKVAAIEAGLSISDASQLANRAISTLLFVRQSSGQQETHYVGVGPIAISTDLDLVELEGVEFNGFLQLSADSFLWGSREVVGSLNAGQSLPLYARYVKPVASATQFIIQFTLRNIGSDTFNTTTLTAQGSDLLSLDGVAYSASVSLGTLAPLTVITIWIKTSSISPKLIPAAIQALSGQTLQSTLNFVAGSGRGYSSIQEVKDYLQTIDVSVITTDEEVKDLLFKSSNEIDKATRRKFDINTVTERYDGVGQQKLVLDNYPIISVLEVQILNPNGQVVTDIKSTDPNFATELIIDSVNGFVTLPSPAIPSLTSPLAGVGAGWQPLLSPYYPQPSAGVPYDYSTHFGRGVSNIAVTYVYGYQTPPEGIRDACKKLVIIELLKKKGASDSQGVATAAIAGMSETFSARGGSSGGTGPFGHTIDELQQDVDATLELFRKRRWLTV